MRLLMLLISLIGFSSSLYAEEEVSSEPEVEYIEMKPKFTVNLDTPSHYMMIKAQLMIEGDDNIKKVKKHLPALRHELIMLYSGMAMSEIQTMQQREALRVKSKEVIDKALEDISNNDGFRDIFFSEFLVN